MSVLVKICGITRLEDALDAIDAGADALGFNFWPGSPRYIEPARASEILRAIEGKALRVAVLVDETEALVKEIDIVQVHGTVTGSPARRWWRALPADTAIRERMKESPRAEAFLVDTPAGEFRGGTGRTFDWSLVAGLDARVILAGGLSPENVAGALSAARPWGVDACSKLEAAPGVKDRDRMSAFVRAVRDWEKRA